MAETEHVKRARVGRPKRQTSSATKREKSENDAKCNRRRINIGEEFGRWTDLKNRFGLKTRAELGRRKLGFDVCHLRSSNLSHYLGIIHAANNLPDVTQILQAFRCPGRTESLHVDVVAGQGNLWVKVIARKAQALHLIWAGQCPHGKRDILLQAEDYVACTEEYPVNFINPTVVFAFYNGVTPQIADALRQQKVSVVGEVVPVSVEIEHKLAMLDLDDESSDDDSIDDDSVSDEQVDDDVDGAFIESQESQVNVSGDSKIIHDTQEASISGGIKQIQDNNFKGGDTKDAMDIDSVSQGQETKGLSRADLSQNSPSFPSDCDKSAENPATTTNINIKRENIDIKVENNVTSSEVFPKSSTTRPDTTGQMDFVQTQTELSRENDKYPNNSQSAGISDVIPNTEDRKTNMQCVDSITRFTTSAETENYDEINKFPGVISDQTQLPQESELEDEFSSKTSSKLDNFSWSGMSLHEFIESELIASNYVSYSKLDEILAEISTHSIDQFGRVNLDVSALITLVAAVSHGQYNFIFKEPILSEQAAEERVDPVLPKLKKFIQGKKLYTCETAFNSFKTILDTLGGEGERFRAKELMEIVTVIPDKPSFRAECLPTTGKIKDKAKIIFGTGDSMQAVTLTSNYGFVRAAQHQGVTFAVYVHAARALTEEKEKTAETIT